jgi:hypothetical protein
VDISQAVQGEYTEGPFQALGVGGRGFIVFLQGKMAMAYRRQEISLWHQLSSLKSS